MKKQDKELVGKVSTVLGIMKTYGTVGTLRISEMTPLQLGCNPQEAEQQYLQAVEIIKAEIRTKEFNRTLLENRVPVLGFDGVTNVIAQMELRGQVVKKEGSNRFNFV